MVGTMNQYVLETRDWFGEQEVSRRFFVEAEDAQMVKYKFHRSLKHGGYADTNFGKHTLENWDLGHTVEIHDIRELDLSEAMVLERYLPEWWTP